jgi:hypothetical protein
VKSAINALVIGTGGFGKHYARILSRLNGEEVPGVPVIDKLILTRTRLQSAGALADSIGSHENCRVKAVVGLEVNSADQLQHLLAQHKPEFIAIAARDKILGDEIHAVYTRQALQYGAVLCEKPFSNAVGDGSSLKYFKALFNHTNRDLFGLDLPFFIVLQKIMQHQKLGEIFLNTRHFEFYWEAMVISQDYIINDLALHPWSLIPEPYRIESPEVMTGGNTAQINLQLFNTRTGTPATCKMTLRDGGNFRGMRLDNYSIAVKIDGGLITLIEMNQSLEDACRVGSDAGYGDVLLTVDNPLKQHIIAVFRRNPVVKLEKAYDSQLFLEMLHGYNRSY